MSERSPDREAIEAEIDRVVRRNPPLWAAAKVARRSLFKPSPHRRQECQASDAHAMTRNNAPDPRQGAASY
jgi:hypothetical protein